MIDYLFVVDDPVAWHEENVARNDHHYSFLKHFGANALSVIQREFGAGVYYNTLIHLSEDVRRGTFLSKNIETAILIPF